MRCINIINFMLLKQMSYVNFMPIYFYMFLAFSDKHISIKVLFSIDVDFVHTDFQFILYFCAKEII